MIFYVWISRVQYQARHLMDANELMNKQTLMNGEEESSQK